MSNSPSQTSAFRGHSLRLKLNGDRALNWSDSAALQGVLMENIDPEYALKLHTLEINPYSFHLETIGGSTFWDVKTIGNEACEKIIAPLAAPAFQSFKLNKINADFAVVEKLQESTELDIAQKLFGQDPIARHHLNLRFVSPTSFKRSKNYDFIPNLDLIFQSLILKYNTLFEGNNEIDAQVLERISQLCRISSYNLRTFYYPVHQAKVPGYHGSISIELAENETLRNYVKALLDFGEYCGVGIKSSLGMGGLRYD